MKTGLVYDPIFLKHNMANHPENAERLNSILNSSEMKKLLPLLKTVSPRLALNKELTYCHSESYIKRINEICSQGGGYLDADTYATEFSYNAAATAAGSLIELATLICKGEFKNGFALVRPPGHHALANNAMGFCIFGNVAIAANTLIKSNVINKAAIIDIDVHHGNGTQAMVEANPNILYISTHQFPFYPGTGSVTETGKGDAEGNVLNIPLPALVGDTGFKEVYNELIIPKIVGFNPGFLIISAGYDAHWKDPLANLNLTSHGYSWISKTLVELSEKLCNGKIVFALEGGYNLDVLSEGVANSIKALINLEDFSDPFGKSPYKEPYIKDILTEIKKIHRI